MKKFSNPEIEMIRYQSTDILTGASNDPVGEGGENGDD